jgi:polysaccharide export outer membrane protein
MPKDLLSITVNTTDPQLLLHSFDSTDTVECCLDQYQYYYAAPLCAISCDYKGEIDFPVIGRLQVGGLTKNHG